MNHQMFFLERKKIFHEFVKQNILPQKDEEKQLWCAGHLAMLFIELDLDPYYFMDARYKNQIIDLKLFENSKGEILDFVKPEFKEFFVRLVKQPIPGFGTPNAATGKGESAFIVCSPFCSKPKKGDLCVEIQKSKCESKKYLNYEIKSNNGKITTKISGKKLNELMIIFLSDLDLKIKKSRDGRECFWNTFKDPDWWEQNSVSKNQDILKHFWNSLGLKKENFPNLNSWNDIFEYLVQGIYDQFFIENPNEIIFFIDEESNNLKFWFIKNELDAVSFYKERNNLNLSSKNPWEHLVEHRSFQNNPFAFYLR